MQSSFVSFVWFDSLRPINNLSVKQGRVFLGWTSTKLGLMCLAQGPQCNDIGEAWTRHPLVSSQALYHWATALPNAIFFNIALHFHLKAKFILFSKKCFHCDSYFKYPHHMFRFGKNVIFLKCWLSDFLSWYEKKSIDFNLCYPDRVTLFTMSDIFQAINHNRSRPSRTQSFTKINCLL